MQPLSAGGGANAEPQVAAAAGQVEDKLGLVATIDAEGGVAAVERAVKKFRAVLDVEVTVVRAVAQRALDVVFEIREKLQRGRRLGHGRDCAECKATKTKAPKL